jgi:molybdate transport system substrate-binding protein
MEPVMKKTIRNLACLFISAVIFLPSASSAEEKINAAVAANYIKPFKEIVLAYEAKTGVKVEATFASTGNLYSQITNGAPYDIFLSADEERPALLLKNGAAEKPFVYAKGEVVLWSAQKNFCGEKDWKVQLKKAEIKKLAIANPVTAPYGTAAKAALEKTGIIKLVESKIVTAQDIAQVFQYASSEAVDGGFCAMSAALSEEGKKGCYYRIKEANAIVQSACVLKRSEKQKETEKFAKFLVSPEALKIKKKYGYK